ncbi:MAG: hypothetical protein KDB01_11065, partial [Planctomycetaceae bacterium]|nr:hypothetical protein [Planctomycetaceae bacterium]
ALVSCILLPKRESEHFCGEMVVESIQPVYDPASKNSQPAANRDRQVLRRGAHLNDKCPSAAT